MVNDILFALWFMLPAGAANVAPVLSARIPFFNNWQTPLDGGRMWRGKEIFGKNKTWRGLISGIVIATLVVWLQQQIVLSTNNINFIPDSINYTNMPGILFGFLFGLGALGGDAVESFFKRRRDIKSGHSWIPFDQLDYILGSIILTLPFVQFTLSQYLWMICLWFLLHIVVSYIGWRVGLKERPV